MSITSIVLYTSVGVLSIIAYIYDKNKALKAFKKGFMAFKKLLPSLVPMLFLLGIMLVLLDRSLIQSLIGNESGLLGMLLSSLIGSIAFMPSFIAFPFGKSLLDIGAGYPQVAALISGLMSVGLVSVMIEVKYFGGKFTILRNLLGFILVILFSFTILILTNLGVM